MLEPRGVWLHLIWRRKTSLKRKMARLDAKSSGRFDAGVASEYKKT